MAGPAASIKRKADTLRESIGTIIGATEDSHSRNYELSLPPHDTLSKVCHHFGNPFSCFNRRFWFLLRSPWEPPQDSQVEQ